MSSLTVTVGHFHYLCVWPPFQKHFIFPKEKKNRGDRCIIFGLSLIFIWLWAQMIFDDCIWDLDDWALSLQSYGLWAFILFLLLSWVWTGTNMRHWDGLYFYFIWVWARALNWLVWLSPISEEIILGLGISKSVMKNNF